MEQKTEDSRKKKTLRLKKQRRRRRFIIWLTADLLVAAVILFLLFYKPAGYIPNRDITNQGPRKLIPRYWTLLGAEIYNRSQLGRPFDLIIEEERLNEAILQETWPQTADSIKLFAPTVDLQPGCVQMISAAELSGAEFILTVQLRGHVDPNGLADLQLTSIKVGAMNITPVAKLVARKAFHNQMGLVNADPDRIETKLLTSLFDNRPFDPVFQVRNLDRRYATVRLTAVEVQEDRIIARLHPQE